MVFELSALSDTIISRISCGEFLSLDHQSWSGGGGGLHREKWQVALFVSFQDQYMNHSRQKHKKARYIKDGGDPS